MARDPERTPVVVDGLRTPFGRYGGALKDVRPDDMAAHVIRALVDRTGMDPAAIDDVILGVVDPVGEAGSDIARFAALKAGLGESVPGVQISRFCASGLDAVNFAAAQIMAGQHELVIGGGGTPSGSSSLEIVGTHSYETQNGQTGVVLRVERPDDIDRLHHQLLLRTGRGEVERAGGPRPRTDR